MMLILFYLNLLGAAVNVFLFLASDHAGYLILAASSLFGVWGAYRCLEEDKAGNQYE